MTLPVSTADQLAALEVLGRAWLAEIRDEPAQHVSEWLVPRDGRWVTGAFPLGLTLEQALGFTLAGRWVEAHDSGRDIYHAPVVATSSTTSSNRPVWRVCLPVVGHDCNLSAAEALPVTRALLTVRRIFWPVRPWGCRDQIAETLELHARAMEADLRGPAPIERVFPPTFLSDLGRNWR